MRILVIQLKRIGDVILTTPLLATLRQHFPEDSITIALDASTATLAAALDADDALIFRRGIAGVNFWRGIMTGNFDVCLDLTGNDRSAFASLVSRARRRVTWSRLSNRPLRRIVYTDFVESSVKNRHTSDHHTDLLRALGVDVENIPLALQLPRAALDEATSAMERVGISGPFAVVHPGTARAEKYWLPERWAEVIKFLRESCGMPVLITGSNDAEERKHIEAIQKALPTPIPDLAGKLSLLGTAALIGKSSLLCAVDSAPVHLADALGTPLVALFGPTNPFHWRPRRASSRIITAAGRWTVATEFRNSPMSNIASTAVIEAIRDLR